MLEVGSDICYTGGDGVLVPTDSGTGWGWSASYHSSLSLTRTHTRARAHTHTHMPGHESKKQSAALTRNEIRSFRPYILSTAWR